MGINAVMAFAVGENNNLITRVSGNQKDDQKDTNLSDCELLLRKFLDSPAAQMEILYTLAEIFDKYENNATLIKETFNELYEISVIDIDAFMTWKDRIQEKGAPTLNYPVIIAATKSFYDALLEEIEAKKKQERE